MMQSAHIPAESDIDNDSMLNMQINNLNIGGMGDGNKFMSQEQVEKLLDGVYKNNNAKISELETNVEQKNA